LSYFVVSDFRSGLDTRRPSLLSSAGTLQKLTNAHVTSGGDIEKRKKFDQIYALPTGTFGLAGVGNTVYVFKQAGSPSSSSSSFSGPIGFVTPTLVVFTITMPGGKTASHLEDWDIFDGKLYAVITATDNTYHHFYDGVYVPEGVGRNVRTYKSKMYSILDKTLYFSAVGDCTTWTPAVSPALPEGQGFINLAFEDAESSDLIGLEVYYNQLAIMSRYATQLWEVDPDPALNNLRQTLRNAGTISPRSVRQYGNGDVLFLHDSGVRSLRAKDSSNAAAVSDIGSPIDPELQLRIRTAPNAKYLFDAFSLVEPVTGRFWLCFSDHIYVLSYFPGPKISAWSEYHPGITLDGGIVLNGRMIFRSGDNLYAYGGDDNNTYDSCEVEVQTSCLHVDKPASSKGFTAIDVAAWGGWQVKVNFDPNRLDAWDQTAFIDEPTYGPGGMIGLEGVSTHITLNLKNQAAGPAILGNIACHYIPVPENS
jgi:hypothetical protein